MTEQRRRRRRLYQINQYLVAFSVSLATACLGAASLWPTPVLVKFHNNETEVNITEEEISWMLAMTSPGFVVGSLATGYLLDAIGRRACILGSALPMVIGTMLLLLNAAGAWLLCLTRFLWGCGTGMIATVAGIYIAEISDKEIRGTLSVVTRFMFNFGSVLTISIGPFVSYNALNYMMLVLPVIYFLACWWIPESPYYYLKETKVDSARKELRKLGNGSEKDLEEKLTMIQTNVKNEMRHSSTVLELFRGKQYRKAIYISAGLKLTQILAGAMTIQQYLGRIMQESKAKMNVSTVLIIFGVIKFAVGIMSTILVDRVGRRPLLIYSYLGTTISFAAVGIYFYLQMFIDSATLSPFGFITLAGIILSTISSSIGYGSVASIIPAEIFPLNVKAKAMTLINIYGGFLGFVVAKAYQQIKDLVGLSGVFWVFAAISLCGSAFTYFFVPETKGKSLEEIQIMLQGDAYKSVKLSAVTVNESDEHNETEEMIEMEQKGA